jgi:fructokinase
MITVAGEALVDLVVDPAGEVSVHPGGAPLNVARTLARLGVECRFLGRVSQDALGRLLLAELRDEGIAVPVADPVQSATTLALATLEDSGHADYRFYLEGTSAGELRSSDIPAGLAGETSALVLGGLGLLIEPMAGTLLELLSQVPDDAVVMLDPNCRRGAIRDAASHRRVIAAVCERADIVKASAEDLAILAPGLAAGAAARSVFGGSPKAVLITNGAGPVTLVCGEHEDHVPVPRVEVVDTVGSGDALVAAFIAWWAARSLPAGELADLPQLGAAVRAAVEISALTCMTSGAEPPRIRGWARRPSAAGEMITALQARRG